MQELLTVAGVSTVVSAVITWAARMFFDQVLKERLARVEAQLNVQSQWMGARLTRADERRARTLSRLHTQLDRALHVTELYVGSHDAGNPEERVEELKWSSVRAWIEFQRAFERAEIFLSAQLAGSIRTYGEAIADARVTFELKRAGIETNAKLETRLQPMGGALAKLGRLQTEVRPQLVREIRAALGAEAINGDMRSD